jgi:hypothetical protein
MNTPVVNTKMKTMRLNTELISQIELLAREQNRTFTNMVDTILKSYTSTTTATNAMVRK